MKRMGTTLSILVLASTFAGSAIAADNGAIAKDVAEPSSYCHQKLPAVRRSTLGTDNPQAKSSQTGDVVDYYGSCDETPTSADQIQNQEKQDSLRYNKDAGHGF